MLEVLLVASSLVFGISAHAFAVNMARINGKVIFVQEDWKLTPIEAFEALTDYKAKRVREKSDFDRKDSVQLCKEIIAERENARRNS